MHGRKKWHNGDLKEKKKGKLMWTRLEEGKRWIKKEKPGKIVKDREILEVNRDW